MSCSEHINRINTLAAQRDQAQGEADALRRSLDELDAEFEALRVENSRLRRGKNA